MSRSSLRLGAVALSVVLAGAVALLFAWALEGQSYNVWGAVVVVPVFVALNAALIMRVSRVAGEPWLLTLLGLAYAAKLVGATVRYAVAYVVYGGAADAERYNDYAAAQYRLWRDGHLSAPGGGARGTHNMEVITTAIYTVVGPSPLAAFFVFSTFAFWGQYLLFRAFRTALPQANGRRYALLVFFLPSMLYWPSSIGKESFLLLFVGVTALGTARWFARRRGAMALLVAGAVGTTLIRPHIALLLFAGLFVAQLFRPKGAQATDVLAKIAGVGVMAVAAAILTTQSASFLGIDDLNWQAVSETLEWRSENTVQGGSEFTPVPATSLAAAPLSLVTVVFRPFPWEAGNIQLFIQSLEGAFLLAITVASWPRLRRLPLMMKRHAYVVFAVVYSAAFVWAFSGFGNFGILARQRVLMLPFFLILLCLPTREQEMSSPQPEKELDDARA